MIVSRFLAITEIRLDVSSFIAPALSEVPLGRLTTMLQNDQLKCPGVQIRWMMCQTFNLSEKGRLGWDTAQCKTSFTPWVFPLRMRNFVI